MRVALVSAPYDTRAFRVGENLGIKYLAAFLDQYGVTSDVFEPALLGMTFEDLLAALLEVPYDVIGFSVMFDSALPNVSRLIAALRTRSCAAHITAGGHVPSFSYDEMLAVVPGLDSVVRFEGERTLAELVQRLREPASWGTIRGLVYRAGGTIVVNPPRDLIADLDRVPFPRRDATSPHLGDPHYFVVTTRGCPFTCTFCSVPAFYKEPRGPAWRARSVGNVVAELRELARERSATAVSFLDDEFLVGRNGKRRAVDVAAELQRQALDLAWAFECRADDVEEGLFARLRDGGLRHVFVGVESGVQRVLDSFRKRTTVDQNRQAIETIRQLGLSLAIGFIMFDPYTTTTELRENVAFLRDMRIATYQAVSNKVLVYRGTGLERQLDREGRLVTRGVAREFRFDDPKVELAYRLTTGCLKPCHDLDVERRRIQFMLDSAAPPLPAPIGERVQRAEEDANAFLLETVQAVIAFVERDPTPAAVAEFEADLADEVARQVDGRLAAMQQLRDGLRSARARPTVERR